MPFAEAKRPYDAAYQREYNAANREKRAAYQKAWKAANREYVIERQRRYRAANPQKVYSRPPGYAREWWLRDQYGLTPAAFDAMLAGQFGRCAICGKGPGKRAFHVDHDHACCPGSKSCGKCVRGILCHGCNGGLGLFGDNPDALIRAAAYLEKRKATK